MTVTVQDNKPQQVALKKKKEEEKPFFESLKEYLKGVRSEFSKITWPDRQQLVSETMVVIVVTTFMTLLILLIDNVLNYIVNLIQQNV